MTVNTDTPGITVVMNELTIRLARKQLLDRLRNQLSILMANAHDFEACYGRTSGLDQLQLMVEGSKDLIAAVENTLDKETATKWPQREASKSSCLSMKSSQIFYCRRHGYFYSPT